MLIYAREKEEKPLLKIQSSIAIGASAAVIWPLLVEPENIMKWCPVEAIRYSGEQQTGINTQFYFEEKAIWRLLKMNFVVTEWVLHKRVAFKMTSGDFVKGYEQRYIIEKGCHGNTFTCFENVKMPYGVLGRIGGLLRSRISVGRLDRMLLKLKMRAEET